MTVSIADMVAEDPPEDFITVDAPTIEIPEKPELACVVCGTELTYGGRGPKPKYCEEHKKGGASKLGTAKPRGSSKDVQAAVDTLDSWYSALCMGLMIGGAPKSANLLAESTSDLADKNKTFLAQAPALAKRIADMGKTTATYGFFSAQAMVLLPVAVLAVGELTEKWGKPKNKSPEDFPEDVPAMSPFGTPID